MTLRIAVWAAVSTKAQVNEDKDSIPKQKENGLAFVENQRGVLIDMLVVPGHSRDYIDFHDCKRDMEAAKIFAFTRLEQHWLAKDFDVLWVRDGSRFARTQALHAYVTARTIVEAGARIYDANFGWVDEKNYVAWSALDGYRVQSEMKEMRRRSEEGFQKLFIRGLPTNANVPDSHLLVRDKVGKVSGVILNSERQLEFERLAHLVLEGMAYAKIEQAMFDQYGYANALNEPHQPKYYWRLLSNPVFWGHMARDYKHRERGPWVRDAGHMLPEGVQVQYGVVPAVYTDTLAEQVKAEMSRREETRGTHRPSKPRHGFAGLLVCYKCGYNMTTAGDKNANHMPLSCSAHRSPTHIRRCDNGSHINIKTIYQYLDAALRQLVVTRDLSTFLGISEVRDFDREITEADQALVNLNKEISNLITLQASASAELQGDYATAIQTASVRRKTISEHREDLLSAAARSLSGLPTLALENIVQQGVDLFWQQPVQVINATLHQLMGNRRLVSKGDEIVGTVDKRPFTVKRYK